MQAETMSPIDPAATLRAATAAHEAGRLDEAESLYRACLAAQPAEAEALHGLGWLCVQRGDWRQALRSFSQALRIRPWEPELWVSQLEALMQLGQVEAVHQLLHRARASGLDAARVAAFEARLHDRRLTHLADAVKASGKTAQQAMQPPERELLALRKVFLERRFDEARDKAKHLLKRYPLAAFGWRVLSLVTPIADDPDFAMLSRRLACELDPEGVDVAMNLALALHELGRLDEAEVIYERVLALQPENVRALVNLGLLLTARRDARARALLERARRLGESDFRVALALGGYLRDLGEHHAAIPLLEEALVGQPDSQLALAALSVCCLAVGRHDDAAALFRRMAPAHLSDTHALGIALFVGAHLETISPEELFAVHRRFGELVETSVVATDHAGHHRDPERRLRVGFVSGDLRSHAMANFLLPLWRALDRAGLEIHAYPTVAMTDAMTAQLRACCEGWCEIDRLGDDAAADRIRCDRIDILVDLSGHTGFNRLGIFARRPAPLQLSWCGYPGTTGLSRIDYYLADTTYVSTGALDAQFTERLLVTEAGCGFSPAPDAPPVAPLPAIANGRVTFGSFNRLSKLTPATLRLWRAALDAVPDATMIIGAVPPDDAEVLSARLAAAGIAPERIELLPMMGMPQYLAAHARIDLLLDAYPYGGGTTTCHGLWMGVPTLTLAGPTLASRSSLSLLGRCGLREFVADDEIAFARMAADWAAQPERLSALRESMRDRLRATPLCNPVLVAHAFEDAMRAIWRRWCAGEPAANIAVPLRRKEAIA